MTGASDLTKLTLTYPKKERGAGTTLSADTRGILSLVTQVVSPEEGFCQ